LASLYLRKDSFGIDLHKVLVIPSDTFYHGKVALREIPNGFGRSSQSKGPRGYDGAGRNDRTGADDCLLTNTGSVEDRGADPDQCSATDVAAVSSDPVRQYNVRVHDQRKVITTHMEDAAVLDIAAGANPDGVDITANKAKKPDIRPFTQLNIPYDQGIFRNKGSWINSGIFPLEIKNHRLPPNKVPRNCERAHT